MEIPTIALQLVKKLFFTYAVSWWFYRVLAKSDGFSMSLLFGSPSSDAARQSPGRSRPGRVHPGHAAARRRSHATWVAVAFECFSKPWGGVNWSNLGVQWIPEAKKTVEQSYIISFDRVADEFQYIYIHLIYNIYYCTWNLDSDGLIIFEKYHLWRPSSKHCHIWPSVWISRHSSLSVYSSPFGSWNGVSQRAELSRSLRSPMVVRYGNHRHCPKSPTAAVPSPLLKFWVAYFPANPCLGA